MNRFGKMVALALLVSPLVAGAADDWRRSIRDNYTEAVRQIHGDLREELRCRRWTQTVDLELRQARPTRPEELQTACGVAEPQAPRG